MTLDTRYFALAIRIVGIFVLAQSIPNALYQALSLFRIFDRTSSVTPSSLAEIAWTWGPMFAFQIAELAVGFYLLFGGGALSRWCIRSCEFNCPRCGYDLEEVKADRCPECGSANVLLKTATAISSAESVH